MHLRERAFVLVVLHAISLHAEQVSLTAFDQMKTNREYKIDRRLSELQVDHGHRANSSHAVNEYGEFQVIQSNVLRITSPTYKIRPRRTKRDANATFTQIPALVADSVEQNTTELSDLSQERASEGRHDKKKKKKKKKKGGLHGLMKKMKHWMPKFMHKMHGPSMFMLGMAQANFNNFVMHALMMSKMALFSVIMMIIREAVFGDKDQPVKYYNFGYEHPHPPRRHIPESYDYPYDYKRRRKRQT